MRVFGAAESNVQYNTIQDNYDYLFALLSLLDLKIIFLTIKKVFVSEGISQQGQATTTKFEGS